MATYNRSKIINRNVYYLRKAGGRLIDFGTGGGSAKVHSEGMRALSRVPQAWPPHWRARAAARALTNGGRRDVPGRGVGTTQETAVKNDRFGGLPTDT